MHKNLLNYLAIEQQLKSPVQVLRNSSIHNDMKSVSCPSVCLSELFGLFGLFTLLICQSLRGPVRIRRQQRHLCQGGARSAGISGAMILDKVPLVSEVFSATSGCRAEIPLMFNLPTYIFRGKRSVKHNGTIPGV